jgi:hypothetical protein
MIIEHLFVKFNQRMEENEMVKCLGYNWFTDKCKNPNSKNYNKPASRITECIPKLIDQNKCNEIISHKIKDDSI